MRRQELLCLREWCRLVLDADESVAVFGERRRGERGRRHRWLSAVAEVLAPARLPTFLVAMASFAVCFAADEPVVIILCDGVGVVSVLVFVMLLHLRPAVGVLLVLRVFVAVLLTLLLLLGMVMLLLLTLHLWEVVLLLVVRQKRDQLTVSRCRRDVLHLGDRDVEL